MKRWISLIAALVLLTGILAACSSSQTTAGNTSSTNAAKERAGEQAKGASTLEVGEGWPRTITDATSRKVVLKERPERVAVLHPLYLDYFFALDTPPIASGSAAKSMKEFATLQPYVGKAEIADLGAGKDLNMEAIIEAMPDVIVTFKGHIDETNYDKLSKIAPVIQIDYSDKWENATMICARIIGKEDKADQLIKETQGIIKKTKDQLGDLKNKSFALLRVDGKSNFTAQGTKNTTYYNETTGFGLMKPDRYPEDSAILTLEALSEMNPDYLIIQHTLDVAKQAILEKEGLAVWKSLKAVKNNHVVLFDNSLNSGSVLAIRLAAENLLKLAE
ncbi:ABC transporter substrate-binding protein [Paenibacillus sp. HWE-109]|uniref:ABC transporter substrate-binding protein n=1 Tax=Paenibacillus sp. HWE-109 TaxID=1306526 RepID=UPI001EDEF3DA|nr:ABC transporter substrate-binding protein [Paenibacillus sp. HWE-109]UKS29452.1 ABC transporter substrate-binding protein [Paenibacillus sp. HWE-109]